MKLPVGIAVLIVALAWFVPISCSTGPEQVTMDDPRMIKYAWDRAGTRYVTTLGAPTRIYAVETTLRELDELDDRHSYGPGRIDIDYPIYFFAFECDYQMWVYDITPDGVGGRTETRHGWLTVAIEVNDGDPRRSGEGPDFIRHPDRVLLPVPKNLESISYTPSELFPLFGTPAPFATAAPPATPAPRGE